MEDIRYQLEIYRVKFNKENELAYVESQKEEIDKLFKNEGTLYCKYNKSIKDLEELIKKTEEHLEIARKEEIILYQQYCEQKRREDEARERYDQAKEREEEARKKFEEAKQKQRWNLMNLEYDISQTERCLSKGEVYKYGNSATTWEFRLDQGNNEIYNNKAEAEKAISTRAHCKEEYTKESADELYSEWWDKKIEIEKAEELLKDSTNKLEYLKMGFEYLNNWWYEEEYYYGGLSHHQFHSKRLESFQCIINNYREFSKNNPNIEGLEELSKEILNEVDIITKLSIKQYINLEKEKEKCQNFKNSRKYGCKNGWEALANRFSVMIYTDRSNPELQKSVMIRMAEHIFEIAQKKKRKSDFKDPDVGEEGKESIGLQKVSYLEELYDNMIDRRKEIISQIEDYFTCAKDNIGDYIEKIENIIDKTSDILKSKSVKYEKIEKLFNKATEIFEKENGKIEEFMKDEEKHPIHNYCNILQNLKEKIETEYYSQINEDINNTVIDPLCFGQERYEEIRELYHKRDKKYVMITEEKLIDLECNLLPIRKYKQQLILEGFRNELLSVYQLLLGVMKTCNPENKRLK